MAASNNVGSILKWGAIAAGLYLAWQYGLFDSLGIPFIPLSPAGAAAAAAAAAAKPATTTPSAAAGGGDPTATTPSGTLATTPTVTGGGGTTGQAQTPATGILSADQVNTIIKTAAGGDIVAAAQATALGIRMRFDQWNYYRSVQTGTDAPATPGLDQVGTASEYLAYRQAQGLSGIASLGRVPLGAVRVYSAHRRASFPLV